MWNRRPLALLATLALVAVPVPALAQDGDADLLAQDPPELEDSLPTPEPQEETPEPDDEPAGEEDESAEPDTGTGEAEADPLPATGGETGLIAALGTGMLLAGSGLRVRLRARS